jgi:hypothetical protein
MEWGVVQKGETLRVKNFPNSEAVVEDSKTVRFKDRLVSYNEWGREVTGWSSINIYDWAVAPNDRTLTDLRAERMESEETSAAHANAVSADVVD